MTKKTILFWLTLLCLLANNTGVQAWQLPPVGREALVKDTAAINRLLQRAYLLRERNPDSSIYLNMVAQESSRQLGYDAGICDSYLGLSRTHVIVNQNNEAVKDARAALLYCTDEKRKYEQETNVYLAFAFVYYFQGRFDSCAWYQYKALNLVESRNITDIKLQLAAYSNVLQFWITVHNDIKHDQYIQNIMRHINEIEKTAIANRDSTILEEVYFRKSGYFFNCGERDSMRYYSKLTIEMAKRQKSTPSVIIASLLNITESYLEDSLPADAIHYANEAIKAMPDKNKGNSRFYIAANLDLGNAYYMQKRYHESIKILELSLEKANAFDYVDISEEVHHTLAKAYDATSNYQQASLHWGVYATMRDSIVKAKNMELVYNVEMKYRLADKERTLAQKELAITVTENRIKIKNIWIGIILTFTCLLMILGSLLFRNNKHKQKLQAEKIRTLHQDLAIGNLQAMIAGEEKERSRIARDLHDGMGGTLAIIRTRLSNVHRKLDTTHLQPQHDLTEILLLLEEASAELRKTAHNLMPEILLREGLIKATLLFCERIRKGYMLEINTEIWGDNKRLTDDFELIVYRMIQELVHNILKHARATQALIQIVFHKTVMSITVEDNGTGITDNKNVQGEGTGLKNIRERISSLNGIIDISSTPGKGTSIYIELPLDTHNA